MKYEITRYEHKFVNNEPKIIIHQIKLLDDNGRYVKFEKLSKAFPELANAKVNFKNLNALSGFKGKISNQEEFVEPF